MARPGHPPSHLGPGSSTGARTELSQSRVALFARRSRSTPRSFRRAPETRLGSRPGPGPAQHSTHTDGDSNTGDHHSSRPRPAAPDEVDATARAISRRSTGADAVFANAARAVGASVLVITGGVGIFLGYQGFPTLKRYGLELLHRDPVVARHRRHRHRRRARRHLRRSPLVAMAIAFPLALATALYISEYAPARIKATLVSLVDLMAAVPSVIYGLWGALLIMPHAAEFAIWLRPQLRLDPDLRRPGRQPRRAAARRSPATPSAPSAPRSPSR